MDEVPITPQSEPAEEGSPPVMRRLRRYAIYCYIVFGTGTLIVAGFRAFLGLTCSALVVMIGHLWLERILDRLLLPAAQVSPWRLGVHILARFTLLGLALAIAIFVARFSPISVILGFSIIVGAIMIEAAHALFKPGDATD